MPPKWPGVTGIGNGQRIATGQVGPDRCSGKVVHLRQLCELAIECLDEPSLALAIDVPPHQIAQRSAQYASEVRWRGEVGTFSPFFARLGSVSGPLLCPDETYQEPTCTRLLSRQGAR